MITKCPMCDNNNDGLLDSIPISDNQVYKIDYGKNVELLQNLLAMIVNIIQEGNSK